MEYHYLWPEVFMPLLHPMVVWLVSALAQWMVPTLLNFLPRPLVF